MHNFITKFGIILGTCKEFAGNRVNALVLFHVEVLSLKLQILKL